VIFFPLPIVRLAGDAIANAIEREFLERDRTKLHDAAVNGRGACKWSDRSQVGLRHNFNNIIAAILGHSEMVEPQLTPEPTGTAY